MEDTRHEVHETASPDLPMSPVLAPLLMMVFWALLGGAAGIKIMETIWRIRGVEAGELTIAIPVGAAAGALAGALLGLIRNPRLVVLLMAVFAGASAGGVAGQLPWGDVGALGGQIVGGLLGSIAWGIWLLVGQTKEPELRARLAPSDTHQEAPTWHGGEPRTSESLPDVQPRISRRLPVPH
jgi:hypothetical protein